MRQRDPRIMAAWKRGQAELHRALVQTAINLALGIREVVIEDAEGNRVVHTEPVAPHAVSIFYLLNTKFGYRETTAHEHSGPEGGPIQTEDLSSAKDAILARFRALDANGHARRN